MPLGYVSPGAGGAEGFAQGSQIGLGLAREQREKAAQEQQMEIHRQDLGLRQQELEARNKERESVQQQRTFEQGRQREADEQTRDKLALAALEKESEMHTGVMAGRFQAAGGKSANIPQEQRDADVKKAKEIASRRDELYRKIYEPQIKETQQKYADLASGLQTGRVDINQLSPKDLYMTIGVGARRDPTDFIRQGGQPNAIDAASQQIQEGMKTGNQDMLLRGMNTVLAPELSHGIGDVAPDGSKITKKEISHIVPDPHGQGKFMPVLKVTTQRADGAEGSYFAPLTSERGTGDHETVPFHDIGKAVDYLGHLNVLGETANNPEIQQKLLEGKKQAGGELDEYLSAYHQIGGKRANIQKSVTREKTNLGGQTLEQTFDESGNPIRERMLQHTAVPKVFNPNVGIGRGSRDLQTIQNYAEDNDISEEEAAAKLQGMGVIRTPRAAGGGAGRGISETAVKGDVRSAADAVASDLGLTYNSRQRGYVQANGAPPTADQQAKLSKAESAANELARDSAASGKRAKASELNEAARTAVKNSPMVQTFKKDVTYTNAKGQKAKYGGKDTSGKDIWLKAD